MAKNNDWMRGDSGSGENFVDMEGDTGKRRQEKVKFDARGQERIDELIAGFAALPHDYSRVPETRLRGYPRQEALKNAGAIEARLFEFLRMEEQKFYDEAPCTIGDKEKVASILLSLVDSRDWTERVAPLGFYEFITLGNVVDYDSAKRILRKLREWDSANGGGFARRISAAEAYRELAGIQQECKWLLTRLVNSGMHGEGELKKLLRSLMEPRPGSGLEGRVVACVNDRAFREAIARRCSPSTYGTAVAFIAKLMREEGIRIVRSTCSNTRPSLRNIIELLESGGITAEEAIGKIWALWDSHEEGWRKERIFPSAITSLLDRMGTRRLSKEARLNFYVVLNGIGEEGVGPELLRRMEQAGCGIPIGLADKLEAEREPPKPIRGKRGRGVRREFVERQEVKEWGLAEIAISCMGLRDSTPPQKKMWVVHRRKGKRRLTQGQKRQLNVLQREKVLAKL